MAILWAQRNTHTPLSIQLTDSNGNALDLTSVSASSISVRFRPNLPVSNYAAGSGTVAITSPATNGVIAYTLAPADVAVSGQFWLNIEVDFGTNDTATGYETVFVVTPA